MANSASGIPVAEALDVAFGKVREDGSARFLIVQIVDETIVETGRHALGGIEEDFGAMRGALDPNKAAYVLFRLDTTGINGHNWLLVSFVPDTCPVKERMLYASTRGGLKRQLGLSYFSDEFHATIPDELAWAAYQEHCDDKSGAAAAAPLTDSEIAKKAAVQLTVDPGHSREYVHSVMFPISAAAVDAMKQLGSAGGNNCVQLRLGDEETLELRGDLSVDINNLAASMPTDEPCFSFVRVDHEHEGQQVSPVVFIYSCFGGSIKQRMIYSTVKAAAVDVAKAQGLTIAKKFEASDADDLAVDAVMAELHPPQRKVVTKTSFSRPMPAGRGQRSRPSRRR